VANSKAYAEIVHELRRADTGLYVNRVVRSLLVGTPFKLVELPSVSIKKLDGKNLGYSFNHIVDMDGMLSGASATWKQRNEFLAAVAAEQDDVAFKEHNNVIESFKAATEKLSAIIGACNPVKKRDILWSGDVVMGTSGPIEMRDEGVEWKSDDPNQRHLKGLRIMFKAVNLRAIRSMSRSLFN